MHKAGHGWYSARRAGPLGPQVYCTERYGMKKWQYVCTLCNWALLVRSNVAELLRLQRIRMDGRALAIEEEINERTIVSIDGRCVQRLLFNPQAAVSSTEAERRTRELKSSTPRNDYRQHNHRTCTSVSQNNGRSRRWRCNGRSIFSAGVPNCWPETKMQMRNGIDKEST